MLDIIIEEIVDTLLAFLGLIFYKKLGISGLRQHIKSMFASFAAIENSILMSLSS